MVYLKMFGTQVQDFVDSSQGRKVISINNLEALVREEDGMVSEHLRNQTFVNVDDEALQYYCKNGMTREQSTQFR